MSNSNEESNLYKIFDKSNIILLIWFLAIYVIISFILGIFYKSDGQTNQNIITSRIIDLLVFIFVGIISLYYFIDLSNKEKEKVFYDYLHSFTNYINSSLSILSTILFIVVFYFVIYVTGISMNYDTKPLSVNIVESGAWIVLTITLINLFFKYVLGLSLNDLTANWMSNIPPTSISIFDISGNLIKPLDLSGNKLDASGNVLDLSGNKKEVFNISNNSYTYDDAKAICKAYGASLATYDNIEESYNNGGEWCNYGWSKDQMIYFPTQKNTWNALQKEPKKKNNCGRPGINGGYMANPYLKFGVNCYGVKPKPTEHDLRLIEERKTQIAPKTHEDVQLDKKAKYWKENADKLLKISSFNKDKWSEY